MNSDVLDTIEAALLEIRDRHKRIAEQCVDGSAMQQSHNVFARRHDAALAAVARLQPTGPLWSDKIIAADIRDKAYRNETGTWSLMESWAYKLMLDMRDYYERQLAMSKEAYELRGQFLDAAQTRIGELEDELNSLRLAVSEDMAAPVENYLRTVERTQRIRILEIGIVRDDDGKIKSLIMPWITKRAIEERNHEQ